MKVGRLLRTVSYLKPTQIFHQVYYRIFAGKVRVNNVKVYGRPLLLHPVGPVSETAKIDQTFTFLNQTQTFPDKIDWNFMGYGKLWNYNLQYCDFLLQDNLSKEIRASWLEDLYASVRSGKVKPEPYPVSLRSINAICFLSAFSEKRELYNSLYTELNYLNNRYEYHLLGNHLLENAFALLMGGWFFENRQWKVKAESILRQQLQEQITADGAHFECSPMYHQIILFRVLEALSYIPRSDDLHSFLREVAARMLSWLNEITFKNGDIPYFKDSAPGVARNSSKLAGMADKLGITPANLQLHESGYHKFETSAYECVIDISGIRPAYQPGHSHADHLSFVLNSYGKPVFVDPGVSTYSISPRRQWERSSKAHNTVTIGDHDQSEVWGGFRVGRRANVIVKNKSVESVEATAEYTIPIGRISHTRKVIAEQQRLIIIDSVVTGKKGLACARYHLHPSIKILEVTNNVLKLSGNIFVRIEHAEKVVMGQYQFAESFNQLVNAIVIEAYFSSTCKTYVTTS